MLLCVLEQPRVDNPSSRPLKRGVQFEVIGPIGLRPTLSHTLPLDPDYDCVNQTRLKFI
jgi:hypothetical protein